ncbi:MAG: type II toxin-antitoxin system VapC family toxin [Thaumarchaeota archaeon]|nr:type II toxin-antitoxin system VapC family toxin [Nitrososphaerota archaeon]
MEEVVVDASVVVKWFVEEEFEKEALKLRDSYVEGAISLSSPALMPFEVMNGLQVANNNEQFLTDATESLTQYGIRLFLPLGPYLSDTMKVSGRSSVSTYDASYVALAERLGCLLYTADTELINRLSVDDKKYVRHISDFRA